MRSLRRAALVIASAAVMSLTIGACGSDSESAASSSPPSTPTTTIAQLAATSTVIPGSTAVGQPIPIGQETTVAPPTSVGSGTAAAGGTASGGTTGPGTTVTGSPGTAVAGPATSSAGGVGGGTSSTTTTAFVPDDDVGVGVGDDPSPNANIAFCTFNAEVEDANDAAVDDKAFISTLRDELGPRMDQWIADAPNNDLRASATTMRDATKRVIATDALDPFDEDPAIEALLRIHLFCG